MPGTRETAERGVDSRQKRAHRLLDGPLSVRRGVFGGPGPVAGFVNFWAILGDGPIRRLPEARSVKFRRPSHYYFALS